MGVNCSKKQLFANLEPKRLFFFQDYNNGKKSKVKNSVRELASQLNASITPQHPGILCDTTTSNDQHSVKNTNELAISGKINLHSKERGR